MAETLSYQAIRSANAAREADELKTDARKKNLLILVLSYLNDEGYIESSNTLARETNIDLNKFEVCDNVDLDTVLMEYESYYYIKFNRYPKITKKLPQNDEKHSKGNKGKGMRRAASTMDARDLASKKLTRSNQSNTSTFSSKELKKWEVRSSSTPSLPKIPAQKPPTQHHGANRPTSGCRKSLTNGATSKKSPNAPPSPAVSTTSEPMALEGLMVSSSNSHHDVSSQLPGGKPRRKAGQIIDIRSMINDATRMNVEEGTGSVGPGQPGDDRLLKPLGGYMAYNSEWRDLAQTISRDIYSENPNVRWDDIIGLDHAKRLAKEAVVYPIRYPQLFTGILSPWKGLLLYGPPGTGKTLLAKAVATECGTTFFNISASSIVSKWRGDSEKLVRVLFELARFHAPSTIFLDELESLMGQRGSTGGGEHEGSRRMKTELLVQMDGLAKTDDLVFLLAASNLPWELDHAMLRRLEKRINVDLPTRDARAAMFEHHLPSTVCTSEENGLELSSDIDYQYVAGLTEGYSGSDIRLVCKEAAMMPVRKIFAALERQTEGKELHIALDTITSADVEKTLSHTKPSAKNLVSKYEAWQKEYESV